jgi:two-component system response regulator FixJ
MTAGAAPHGPVIVIDDHESARLSLRALLESASLSVRDFGDAIAFLAALPADPACLIVDVRMPHMTGLELQEELARRGVRLPLIVVTGHADVALAVRAMKGGAQDFLEKPYDDQVMLDSVRRAIAQGVRSRANPAETQAAAAMLDRLTPRERDVLGRLAQGESNKEAAHKLGISPRTVEIHRANIQEKLKARSLSDLVRLVRMAGQGP